MSHRAWAEINLNNFENNIDKIRKYTGTGYLCVIKANAYGHGDIEIARSAEKMGVDYFGIATIDEAVALRKSGIKKPILIFGYTAPEDAERLVHYSITQTIYSEEYAELLANSARQLGVCPQCHIKIDTGMNRLGFDGRNPQKIAKALKKFLGVLAVTGAFTHLAVADEDKQQSREFTLAQIGQFNSVCDYIAAAGIPLKVRHYANSAQALRGENIPLGDMVRVGIAQYGLSPFESDTENALKLEPVMSLYATVAMVKEIDAGDSVSYGRCYTAREKRRAATITIGYADGYPRALSGRGYVLINGKRAPVIGRVCMDQLVVDVSDIAGVKIGDRATIVGNDGTESITFETLADMTDTIHYERMCAISLRVQREYVRK